MQIICLVPVFENAQMLVYKSGSCLGAISVPSLMQRAFLCKHWRPGLTVSGLTPLPPLAVRTRCCYQLITAEQGRAWGSPKRSLTGRESHSCSFDPGRSSFRTLALRAMALLPCHCSHFPALGVLETAD